jgi:hypothetical protein
MYAAGGSDAYGSKTRSLTGAAGGSKIDGDGDHFKDPETGDILRKYINLGKGKPFLNFKEFHENALSEMQVNPPAIVCDYEKISRHMQTGLANIKAKEMVTLMRDDVSTLGWDKFVYLYCLAIPDYPLIDA